MRDGKRRKRMGEKKVGVMDEIWRMEENDGGNEDKGGKEREGGWGIEVNGGNEVEDYG